MISKRKGEQRESDSQTGNGEGLSDETAPGRIDRSPLGLCDIAKSEYIIPHKNPHISVEARAENHAPSKIQRASSRWPDSDCQKRKRKQQQKKCGTLGHQVRPGCR